jgi:hypothetical protein
MLSPFLFALFLEPFLRWLTVGSRGYRLVAPTTSTDPNEPTVTYSGHGFADDTSLATDSPTNMSIQLKELSLFRAYTGMKDNVTKCCITGALLSKGNAHSRANCSILASRTQRQHALVHGSKSLIRFIDPSETHRVLEVELNTALFFTKH